MMNGPRTLDYTGRNPHMTHIARLPGPLPGVAGHRFGESGLVRVGAVRTAVERKHDTSRASARMTVDAEVIPSRAKEGVHGA
jgi:hypothetical protein